MVPFDELVRSYGTDALEEITVNERLNVLLDPSKEYAWAGNGTEPLTGARTMAIESPSGFVKVILRLLSFPFGPFGCVNVVKLMLAFVDVAPVKSAGSATVTVIEAIGGCWQDASATNWKIIPRIAKLRAVMKPVYQNLVL